MLPVSEHALSGEARLQPALRGRRRARLAARAVLRPRLRAGDHAVHGADGARHDVGRPRQGPAGARRPVVDVDRLRLADERRRPGGARRPGGDHRVDGGAARRGAVRAAGVRRHGAALRVCLSRLVRILHIALFILGSRDDPALRSSVCGLAGEHRDRRRAADRGLVREQRPGAAIWLLALVLDIGGPEVLRCSTAGGSCPGTSPSATG